MAFFSQNWCKNYYWPIYQKYKYGNRFHILYLDRNSEFRFLLLEELPKEKIDKYKKFLIKNNIALINCPMRQGDEYVVKGEGHPSALGHKITSECIYKEIEILNTN